VTIININQQSGREMVHSMLFALGLTGLLILHGSKHDAF